MSSSTEYDWTHLYESEHVLPEPLVLVATVVHGFKRGSKELGIPTANLCMEELGDAGNNLETGIYYGRALLLGQTYDAVVSIGWNPFYKNTKKTIEAHLLASLEDFYGTQMELTLNGYLRPEADFKGLGELIDHVVSSYFISKTFQMNLFLASIMTSRSPKKD